MHALRTQSPAYSHVHAEMRISNRALDEQPRKTGGRRIHDQAVRLITNLLHDRPNADL